MGDMIAATFLSTCQDYIAQHLYKYKDKPYYEDLTQEVYLKHSEACKQIYKKKQPVKYITAYLHKCYKHCVLDFLKALSKETKAMTTYQNHTLNTASFSWQEKATIVIELMESIGQLPPQEQALILTLMKNKMKMDKTAEALGITLKSAYNLRSRAITKLASTLSI